MADPQDGYRALQALPGGAAVTAAWRARDTALRAYYHALARQHREPRTVLPTLLHEHHVRAVGVDPATEHETRRLARTVALRRLAVASSP